MTLREKFERLKISQKNTTATLNIDLDTAKECEQIADDYAIEFLNWYISKSSIMDIKYIGKTSKELLEKFKKKIRSCEFWAETWAISTLERILNIKFIILSSEAYKLDDLSNVLQCGQLNDTILQNMGVFNPEFYIMVDYI